MSGERPIDPTTTAVVPEAPVPVPTPGEVLTGPLPGALTAVTEAERARALRELSILDMPREDRFARVVRLARRLFDVSAVTVSLVEADGRWSTASAGLGSSGASDDAFRTAVLQSPGAIVVPDTHYDRRFRNEPLVRGLPRIRFFAGHPLEAPGGHRVGALAIMDPAPRDLSATDRDLLRDLAHWVQKELASDEELVRANEVQRSLLPKIAPVVPGYDIAGRCVPARDLAGDFFDYFMVGDELQVSVADVMGKGMAAAIIAASVRAVLRGATRFIGVTEAVNRVAVDLAPDLADTSTFVTLFSARLDPAQGALTYVDAGHGLSSIITADGELRRLESADLPLGALDGSTWAEHHATIDVGDTFVSISDGLLDYFDTPDDAANAVVRSTVAASGAEDLIERICNYSMGHLVMDDLTAVVVRRLR